MKTGQLSRADLLAALLTDDRQSQETIAGSLGLFRQPEEISADSPKETITGEARVPRKKNQPLYANPSPTALLRSRYLRVVQQEQEQDKKQDKEQPVPVQPVTWRNRPQNCPPYPELATLKELRSRLFPLLDSNHVTGRAIDFPRLIDKLSQAEFPGKLPRKQAKHHLPDLQIIDDRQRHLSPYWLDHSLLTFHLFDEFGATHIHRAVIPAGETQVRSITKENTLCQYRLPPSGSPVLLVSDLGRLHNFNGIHDPVSSTTTLQHNTLQLIQRLRQNNNPVIVLTPCHCSDYPARLRKILTFISWEKDTTALSPTGNREREWVENILNLAAPAIRFEPELLRSLRRGMRQFDIKMPTAIESLLWQHPAIKEPHNVAATLHGQARKKRTEHFLQDVSPAQQAFAMRTLRNWRATLPCEIWFEEILAIEPMLKSKGASFSNKEQIELTEDMCNSHDFLAQIAATQQLTGEEGKPYLAWLARVDKRISETTVQQGVAGRTMQSLLQHLCPGANKTPGGHLLDPDLSPASSDLAQQSAWLCQSGGRLTIQRHQSHTIPGKTHSVLAPLTYRKHEAKLIRKNGSTINIHLPTTLKETPEILTGKEKFTLHEIETIKTDQSELNFQAGQRPLWASSMGCDQFGLYAEIAFPYQQDTKISQRFRWIAPGSFMMGSPDSEKQRMSGREAHHQVSLNRGYWLADTTVSQMLWKSVMGENPAYFQDNIMNPVENVSWDDAQTFIEKINASYQNNPGLDGLVFRLPTEAEWEHACRAGTTTPFSFGENISPDQVNYNGKYPYADGATGKDRNKTVAVKSLPANPWGLYEMHGNVWEWCADAWKAELGSQSVSDPYQQGVKGSDRVVRGGSWNDDGRNVRSAIRNHGSPGDRDRILGFRLFLGHELQKR